MCIMTISRLYNKEQNCLMLHLYLTKLQNLLLRFRLKRRCIYLKLNIEHRSCYCITPESLIKTYVIKQLLCQFRGLLFNTVQNQLVPVMVISISIQLFCLIELLNLLEQWRFFQSYPNHTFLWHICIGARTIFYSILNGNQSYLPLWSKGKVPLFPIINMVYVSEIFPMIKVSRFWLPL